MTVSHPALRALLARWTAHRGRAAMPSRDELPFINLAPWRGHIRQVEVEGPLLDRAYREAVLSGIPVRAIIGTDETLVLPFAGSDRRAALLLVVSYEGHSAEDADERRHQQRQQRRAHEDFARGALEKA